MPVAATPLERADGLVLIGESQGSGYRTPPALVRRSDGQTLQLTPLLYAVVEAIDGRRTVEEVADEVHRTTGKPVSPDNVTQLVDSQLRPLGLLTTTDGAQPQLKRSDPLLGLKAKVSVTDPARTRALTAPFALLFTPLLWVPVVAVFLAVSWWLLLDKGLASAAKQAFDRPVLLLLVVAVTVLSAGFHEFGHAAAARRGGAQPGVMGAGIYLVWPAFYTDVTDSYRLDRRGRVRTDLGGLYFNAIVAVGIVGIWLATEWDALLLVVATQILQMLRQLLPLVRFDGYHVLADTTGVPDLFSRIGPVLKSLWPFSPTHAKVTELKPWARAVVALWVLVTVPALLFAVLAMAVALPRLAGTAWASAQRQADYLGDAVSGMQVVDSAAALLSLVAVGFPVLAMGLILVRTGRQVFLMGWRRAEGSLVGRAGVLAVTGAVVAGLVFLWWPRDGAYRPIQEGETGTLQQVVGAAGRTTPSLAAAPASADMAEAGARGRAVSVLPADAELPTRDQPMQALVLVPRDDDGATDDGGAGTEDPTWVFPFDRPLPPDEGDTQALAVNTTDRTVQYDVAMAMVWVEDPDQVLTTNEAYAFASCSDCVTVAISFQTLIIVGQSDVIIPQNKSAAVNYECFECITAAVAKQLVITVEEAPGEEKLVELAAIWAELAEFAATIPGLPLSEVLQRLEEFEEQIKAVLTDAVQQAPAVQSGSGSDSSETTDSGSSGSEESPASSPTASASASSSPTSRESGDPEPTATTSPTATSTPTATASPTSP